MTDDKFWLSKVKELIAVLAGAEENRAAPLNFELLFKKIYESQEGGV